VLEEKIWENGRDLSSGDGCGGGSSHSSSSSSADPAGLAVCGHTLAGIAGSNSGVGVDVRLSSLLSFV
jgi:hypothetical protein